MPPLNIFLDDGGVITDKQRRVTEFGRLVGDCFVPLLGGTQAAWTRAHRTVVDRLADPQSASTLAAADFVGFYRAYQLRWVAGMCELLGLPTPPEEKRLDLAYRALGWITRRIHAALPGAVETIHLLHRQGYALHTASGSCSLDGSKREEWSDFRPKSDQSAPRVISSTIDCLRSCSLSCFFQQRFVN